jgi:hypothetical protein
MASDRIFIFAVSLRPNVTILLVDVHNPLWRHLGFSDVPVFDVFGCQGEGWKKWVVRWNGFVVPEYWGILHL